MAFSTAFTRRQWLNLSVVAAAAVTLGARWEDLDDLTFLAPFDILPLGETTRPAPPDNPIAPVLTLDNKSRYAIDDPSRSVVDPTLELTYEQSVTPLRQFSEAVIKLANRFVASDGRNLDAAAQAAGHLVGWAQADALNRIVSVSAQLNRSTTLSAASLAYLQVAPGLARGDRDLDGVLDWFRRGGDAIARNYNDTHLDRMTSQNNHRYWAGLGACGCGLAARDKDLVEWGLEACWLGLAQVTPEGALPHELARGKRALYYHAYAIGPLVMLAEIGERNGRSMYAAADGALHRLIDFTLAGMDDPSQIETLAGARQERLGRSGARFDSHQVAWLEVYESRFPGRSRWSGRLAELRPLGSTSLGGNLSLLYRGEAGMQPASDRGAHATVLRGRQT